MREIKFRAWHKRRKQMYKVQYMGLLSRHATLEVTGFESSTYSFDEIILEQFTGLCDKNGKEIFEGDIIKLRQFLFDGTEYENEIIGVISYKEATTSFGLIEIKHKKVNEYMGFDSNEEAKDNFVPICLFYGLHDESFEVIGNIYENEELIE